MDTMIAYCGLTCTECPGYIATQANDRAELERVAAMWRKEFDAPEITVESVICDGCVVTCNRILDGKPAPPFPARTAVPFREPRNGASPRGRSADPVLVPPRSPDLRSAGHD